MGVSRRTVFALALLLAAPGCKRSSAKATPVDGPLAAGAFGVVALDDAIDPFVAAERNGPPPAPAELRVEMTPLGPDGSKPHRYLLLPAPSGEALEQVLGPVREWAGNVELPAGRVLTWGSVLDDTNPSGPPKITGWRSWVLEGRPVVDGRHVQRAELVESQFGTRDLQITLTPAGATALETFTRAQLGRRVALVVGGEVRTSPVVKTPIAGGKLRISGPTDAQALLRELAKR